jgi:hypothetical protein
VAHGDAAVTWSQTFLVRRDDLTCVQVVPLDVKQPLTRGQVRVRNDHFAFTANNITYAVFGDSLQYWHFFPASDGWGSVPVWGFGTVESSACDGIAMGERLYGYWPMATHAVLQPGPIGADGFSDASPHRAGLPAVYNRYLRTPRAAGYDADREGEYAVLRPLFATAWLIDDFLHAAGDFGARTLLLSSASSKTACATAFCLQRRDGRNAHIVGATSAARRPFVAGLGVYDQVLAYEELTTLPAGEPAAYIDFSGDAALRRAVHEHWRDVLALSSSIGGTHHGALGSGKGLPGPKPQLFFAPAQMRLRSAPPPQGLGRAGLFQHIDAAWSAFVAHATRGDRPWLTIEHRHGTDAMRTAYFEILEGRGDAGRGLMLSF